MLSDLSISHLAIIDSMHVRFEPGFNVITGETGTGKSILIRALNFLVGAKVTATETIRTGQEQAEVAGTFHIGDSHPAVEPLRSLDVLPTRSRGPYTIELRRTLALSGKSHAWVNKTPMPLTTLRQVGLLLLDIFGQNENHRLLDPLTHSSYLDLFLVDHTLVSQYAVSHQRCQAALSEIQTLLRIRSESPAEIEFLQYRVEELQAFAPNEEDYDEIRALCRNYEHNEKFRQEITSACQMLQEGAEGSSLSSLLGAAAERLLRLKDERLGAAADKLSSARTLVDDVEFDLLRSLPEMQGEGRDFESAQARLAEYQRLMRKTQSLDVARLVQYFSETKQRLDQHVNFEKEVFTLVARLQRLAKAAEVAARSLSRGRASAAARLCQGVLGELADLGMRKARIEVQLTPTQRPLHALSGTLPEDVQEVWSECAELLAGLSENGAERVQFLLSANLGEDLRPLAKVSSGGEASRILLALKSTLAVGADACVLVFDEIDSGISGRTADMVGAKLARIAERFQVICISHLPQVAAYADAHFSVSKEEHDGRTATDVRRLRQSASAREIARMLSGPEITRESMQNAKGMVARAGRLRKPVDPVESAAKSR